MYCYESKCLTPYQELLGLYKISRNGRVCFIYTAVCVSALPKNTYLAMCEGSQLREWLLFFGLPVLTGKLPQEYLQHFSLLVASIHVLLSDMISILDLNKVQDYLKEFYIKLPQLYGTPCL